MSLGERERVAGRLRPLRHYPGVRPHRKEVMIASAWFRPGERHRRERHEG